MSRLLVLLLSLFVVAEAEAAVTHVQSTAKAYLDGATNGSVAFSVTPTTGNTILVTISSSMADPLAPYGCTVTLNTIAMGGSEGPPSGTILNRAGAYIYTIQTALSGTVAINLACASAMWITFQGHEFSGVLPNTMVTSSVAGGPSTTPTNTGFTDVYADGLMVMILAEDYAGTATITPQGGWTERWEQEDCAAHQCGSVVTQAVTTQGNVTHTWTLAQVVPYSILSAFLPSSGSSGGPQPIARHLQWNDNQPGGASNELGFNIYKRTSLTAPNWIQAGSVGANVTQFSTTIQPTELNDCWRVNAFNSAGSSGFTNEACPTVVAPTVCTLPAPGTTIARLLSGQHSTNPRYFTDSNGCPIYLTGSHTWSNLQDGDGNAFTWSSYLAMFSTYKWNLARMWLSTSPYGVNNFPAPGYNGSTPWYNAITPNPYARHGSTCCAADGGNKFDLDTFNSTFWTRLNDRIHDLKNAGVYAMVMAFNRFDHDNAIGGREVWAYHPYNSANNTNSLNGDTNANNNGEELHQLGAGTSASIGAVGTVSHATGTTHTTSTMNVNAGSTVGVCVIWDDSTTISSVQDDAANNFTAVGSPFAGADNSLFQWFYRENIGASATRTVTVTTAANAFINVHAVELRGVPTSGAFDTSNQQRATSSPYVSPGITTSTAASILVGCSGANTNSAAFTHTHGNAFTLQVEQGDGTTYWVTSLATRIVTSAATYNTSVTYAGGTVNNTTQAIAAFKATPSGDSPVNTRQKAFLAKLCDELCDEPNVAIELANESNGTLAWANEMMAYWRTYCLTKTYCPMIGFTGGGGHDLASLYQSNGPFTAPAAQVAYDAPGDPLNSNPPATDGGKIQFLDSDHTGYMVFRDAADFTRAWVWKAFTRGYNPILMEDLQNYTGWLDGRLAMGHTRLYADRIPLSTMLPQQTQCSTTYCLISPGLAYLVYQPTSGAFTVTLQAGTYSVEWFNPESGVTQTDANLTAAGGAQAMTPPFTGTAVLYLATQAAPPHPPPPPPPPPPPAGLSITGVPSLLEEEML